MSRRVSKSLEFQKWSKTVQTYFHCHHFHHQANSYVHSHPSAPIFNYPLVSLTQQQNPSTLAHKTHISLHNKISFLCVIMNTWTQKKTTLSCTPTVQCPLLLKILIFYSLIIKFDIKKRYKLCICHILYTTHSPQNNHHNVRKSLFFMFISSLFIRKWEYFSLFKQV